jgi:hypothetical protein
MKLVRWLQLNWYVQEGREWLIQDAINYLSLPGWLIPIPEITSGLPRSTDINKPA